MDSSSEIPSFGTLLKRYRDRRKLTQKALGSKIKKNRTSIQAWEYDTYVPENRNVVLALARALSLQKRG